MLTGRTVFLFLVAALLVSCANKPKLMVDVSGEWEKMDIILATELRENLEHNDDRIVTVLMVVWDNDDVYAEELEEINVEVLEREQYNWTVSGKSDALVLASKKAFVRSMALSPH